MNCVRCHYLLWDLPDNRCPECGLHFEVTDYAFPPGDAAFVCTHCGESYLGSDAQGLPEPRRFECRGCHTPLDVATLPVRPLKEDINGEPVRVGTPWEFRRRVGFFRSFLDGVARLAIHPAEYFRLSAAGQDQGEMIFSILCAYAAAALLLVSVILLQNGGLLVSVPDLRLLLKPRWILLLACAVPLIQVAWNYLYGMLIQTVLLLLGRQNSDFEASVRAVAFGSAVLPAVLLFAPIGVPWYINVVSSGIEHLHGTSRGHALIAALVPMLLGANVLLFAAYLLFLGG